MTARLKNLVAVITGGLRQLLRLLVELIELNVTTIEPVRELAPVYIENKE